VPRSSTWTKPAFASAATRLIRAMVAGTKITAKRSRISSAKRPSGRNGHAANCLAGPRGLELANVIPKKPIEIVGQILLINALSEDG
jgi:hypothetical protein